MAKLTRMSRRFGVASFQKVDACQEKEPVRKI